MRQRRGHSKTKRRAWAYAATSAAAVFAGASVCAAQEVTSYWSGVTGSWTDPTQWSTDPNYPNNGTPSGVTYDAVINAPGTDPYTVTLNSNVTVDSVTMDSPSATFSQTGGTLTTPVLNVAAGGYSLENGSLQGATLTASNAAIVSLGNSTVSNSTLDLPASAGVFFDSLINDTLGADLTTDDTMFIEGLNAAGYTVNAAGDGGTLRFYSATPSPVTLSNINVNLGGGQPVSGQGAYLTLISSSSGVPAIDNSTTVEGWGAVGRDAAGTVDPALINQGIIAANVSRRTLAVVPTALINIGTLQATNGGILSIAPGGSTTWTNNGILGVDSTSAININQNLTPASGSAFNAVLGNNGASGIVTIAGNLKFQSDVSLNLSMLPGAVFSGPYEIASYTGTLTGSFAEVTPGYTVSYSQPGEILVTADSLLTSPLPEPSGVMLCGGACALLARRRRKARVEVQI